MYCCIFALRTPTVLRSLQSIPRTPLHSSQRNPVTWALQQSRRCTPSKAVEWSAPSPLPMICVENVIDDHWTTCTTSRHCAWGIKGVVLAGGMERNGRIFCILHNLPKDHIPEVAPGTSNKHELQVAALQIPCCGPSTSSVLWRQYFLASTTVVVSTYQQQQTDAMLDCDRDYCSHAMIVKVLAKEAIVSFS